MKPLNYPQQRFNYSQNRSLNSYENYIGNNKKKPAY